MEIKAITQHLGGTIAGALLGAVTQDMLVTAAGAALGLAFSLGLRYVLTTKPEVKAELVKREDYIALALNLAATLAELTPHKGPVKLSYAITEARKILAENGIDGNAADLTRERLVADLEEIVAQKFPKKATE